MAKLKIHNFFIYNVWTDRVRFAVWVICFSVLLLLYLVRVENEAEFAFASLAILPVIVMAWFSGKRDGIIISFFAAAMWYLGDVFSERQFSRTWIPWVNSITRLSIYILVTFCVAKVRLLHKRERRNATCDELTGLQNRRGFFEAGALEVERSKRNAHPMAIIFMDLDDFKLLNDNKGHDAGDAALRAVASVLPGTLRSKDIVARIGGDEFAALIPEISHDMAVAAAQQISIAINKVLEDFPPVKVSLGMAWFEKADGLFPEMLKAADKVMYELKEKAKGGRRKLMRRNRQEN